jgi:hypothetical protein
MDSARNSLYLSFNFNDLKTRVVKHLKFSHCYGISGTINGFVPKPRPLKEMDWLQPDMVKSLSKEGIKNTQHFFEAVCCGPTELARNTGMRQEDVRELLSISDLCRIQWVSPNFARALVAVGAADAATVATAIPETLYEAIKKANSNAEFYKGTVGLRDVKRLMVAAGYVLDTRSAEGLS